MGPFLVLWSGQLVSLIGGGMTRFAFVFYAYQTGGGLGCADFCGRGLGCLFLACPASGRAECSWLPATQFQLLTFPPAP